MRKIFTILCFIISTVGYGQNPNSVAYDYTTTTEMSASFANVNVFAHVNDALTGGDFSLKVLGVATIDSILILPSTVSGFGLYRKLNQTRQILARWIGVSKDSTVLLNTVKLQRLINKGYKHIIVDDSAIIDMTALANIDKETFDIDMRPVVFTLGQRDAINVRAINMQAYVAQTDSTYTLTGGYSNFNWVPNRPVSQYQLLNSLNSLNSIYVHLTGAEAIDSPKTFNAQAVFPAGISGGSANMTGLVKGSEINANRTSAGIESIKLSFNDSLAYASMESNSGSGGKRRPFVFGQDVKNLLGIAPYFFADREHQYYPYEMGIYVPADSRGSKIGFYGTTNGGSSSFFTLQQTYRVSQTSGAYGRLFDLIRTEDSTGTGSQWFIYMRKSNTFMAGIDNKGNYKTDSGTYIQMPLQAYPGTNANKKIVYWDAAGKQFGYGDIDNTLPRILSTTVSINGKVAGTSTLYTVPAGKTLIVTGVVVVVTAASGITAPFAASVTASTSGTIRPSTTLTGLTSLPQTYRYSDNGASVTAGAGETINFVIDTPATGTSQTVAVDLIGYFR